MDLEKIYKNHFSKVYKFFYYRQVQADNIEDICHDVFIRFYTKYKPDVLTEEEILKILYGFCRNMYKEWVRKQINLRSVSFHEFVQYFDTLEVFADESYELRIEKQKDIVRGLIPELNETVQNVIVLRFFHGKSRKDVAAELGITEADVHTYQKRGIRYLRQKIQKNNIIF